ncbi:uncharacterized protein LOC128276446 [Anopheles cruzii]|uniref:uncharacterized protein LOC128276444 n=1 Tax=Anopheles cruzii TaxID=68878 RepID=UPI0022EC60C0|nr:uncharacterized protein LOC128276444 [Anopheles cruzii]XP_052870866.1 uncharacterized protein LOC128276446 [Anopheles cruzii]
MGDADQLVEISSTHWMELKDLFKNSWPKHEFAYYLLCNYVRWTSADPRLKENIKIYSLNGCWRTDETFALKEGFEIYFYSAAEGADSQHLVRLLSLMDWDAWQEISMDYLERFHAVVEKVINIRGLSIVSSCMANYYYLVKNQALEMNIPPLPEGFAFESLHEKHLSYIYSQWPLKDNISYESGYRLLKRLIQYNESVGLFDRSGLLVSWCLSDQTGAHSDLQTAVEHKRRGYGRMVVVELAKRLARRGSDSKAYVLSSNENSIKLFEGVGFRKIENLRWVVVHPRDPTMTENLSAKDLP